MSEFTMDVCYNYKGFQNRLVTLRKEENGMISVLNEFDQIMANCFSGYDVGCFLTELFKGKFA